MPLYEKVWWKKMFKKHEKPAKVNALHDVQAIIDCLEDLDADVKKLLPDLKKLEQLEEELEMVGSEQLKKVNLQTQAEVIERILVNYEAFENDIDINGLRVKEIAHDFLKRADKAGLAELVNEKRQNPKWKFFW